MNDKHTPWIQDGLSIRGNTRNGVPSLICTMFDAGCGNKEPMLANAALIVRAVNSHQELLEACKAVLEADNCGVETVAGNLPLLVATLRKKLLAAIAKAEGQVGK